MQTATQPVETRRIGSLVAPNGLLSSRARQASTMPVAFHGGNGDPDALARMLGVDLVDMIGGADGGRFDVTTKIARRTSGTDGAPNAATHLLDVGICIAAVETAEICAATTEPHDDATIKAAAVTIPTDRDVEHADAIGTPITRTTSTRDCDGQCEGACWCDDGTGLLATATHERTGNAGHERADATTSDSPTSGLGGNGTSAVLAATSSTNNTIGSGNVALAN